MRTQSPDYTAHCEAHETRQRASRIRRTLLQKLTPGTHLTHSESHGSPAVLPGRRPGSLRRGTAAGLLAALFSSLAIIFAGCTPPFRVYQASDAYLKQGLPRDMGLAYGRIMVRGWSATASGDYATSVEFRNRITGYTFTHQLSSSGEFHWVLHAGSYEITDVWSGFERVSQQAKNRGIYFNVPAGHAAYLGDLLIQLPSSYASGAVELLDNFDAATRHLYYRYPSLKLEESPDKQLFSTLQSRG